MDPEGFGMSNDSQTSKSTSTPILQARGLVKRYGRVVALDNADLDLMPGEILGVLGESGSGKSTLAASVLRLLPPNGQIGSGAVLFEGKNLLQASSEELRQIRGARIALGRARPGAAYGLSSDRWVGSHLGLSSQLSVKSPRRVVLVP